MNNRHRVLIIEDSESLAAIFSTYLGEELYEVRISMNLKEARQDWESFMPDIVLLDLELPDGNGMELLSDPHLDTTRPDVIVMTAFGSNEIAAKALRSGAIDYLSKPFDADRLNTTIRNLVERRTLSTQVAQYVQMNRQSYCGFIGSSLSMQSIYRIIDSVAPSKATGFIMGESGTGKELAASAIHQMSGRTGAFHAINCGAIPNEIMESEIFGHVKGAFTGASNNRDGAASFAKNGTLFLDEICEMDLTLQKKMLRFLQTGEFQRVGSNITETVEVRFVCATNRNPLEEVRAGRFREDLYYRLHVVPIELPPLRERGGDILVLANSFLQTCTEKEGKEFGSFSDDAASDLLSYPWPGNVRELQNVIQNAVILNQGSVITETMLSFNKSRDSDLQQTELVNTESETPRAPAHEKRIEPLWMVERRVIEAAIATCAGNVHKAAALLEVSPSTIYRKLQTWNVKPDLDTGAA
jgi:two-component system repressor protein LuxO